MIKEEEYEIVGYIKKSCLCDKCFCEMQSTGLEALSNPPQRIMKCPKCGKEEYIDADALTGQWKMIKKEVDKGRKK